MQFALLITCLLWLQLIHSGRMLETFRSNILRQILVNYDSRIIPVNEDNSPVVVKVSMVIRNIHKVNSRNMEFSVELNLRQTWLDPRLNYSAHSSGLVTQITLTDSSPIWKPDLFFPNEISAKLHSLLQPNVMVRILPSGHVLFSSRISVTLACPMDLRRYPFDQQSCPIKVASYAYTSDQMKLEWQTDHDPIHVSPVSIPLYFLQKVHNTSRTSVTSTGSYTTLQAQIDLRRDSQSYLYHVFLPSVLLVLLGWLAMWLHIQEVQARLLLSLMALLAFAAGLLQLNSRLPHVAHPKAIDIWCGICLLFLLLSLIESVLVANVYGWPHLHHDASVPHDVPAPSASGDLEPQHQPINKSLWKRFQRRLNRCSSNKIDVICRTLFPVSFALFVIIFSVVYL